MKLFVCDSEEDAILYAKNEVYLKYEHCLYTVGRTKTREFSEEAFLDISNDPSKRIRLIVLKGTPPKGTIIIDRRLKFLNALDCFGESIFQATWN